MDCTSKLITAVSNAFTQYGFKRTYWVGYSGGLDSRVLLEICARLRSIFPIKLRAIYINHGLSPHAATWAAHCQAVCNKLQIDFQAVAVCLNKEDGSLEEIARKARYHVFSDLMSADDMLVTAHHQDDQAETVLLQLCRGAGLKGLSAMPALKVFAKGYHARPLLPFSREELEMFADENNLTWVEDESNADSRYSRNFIRNKVLPLLKQHWVGAAKSIARSAQHCSEAQRLLDSNGFQLLEQAKGRHPNTLCVDYLLSLSLEHRRLVLRSWIAANNFLMPDAKKLQRICAEVLTAAADRFPLVSWSGTEVRRYQNDLYVMKAIPPHDVSAVFEWDFKQELQLPSGQILTHQDGLSAVVDKVQVKFRRGGEVIKLAGRGTHALKKLFQEWQIPPWQRERVPLLFYQEELVAVVGYAIHADYVS